MSSTTDDALPLPVSGGSQAGVLISDTGQPNDGAKAPLIFLGDPHTGKKDWAGSITPVAAPTVTNPLTATADNSVTFAQQVRQLWIRNNTSSDIYVEFDAAASTASWPVLAGETQVLDVKCTVLHIYPASAVSVNVASGVTVKGGI